MAALSWGVTPQRAPGAQEEGCPPEGVSSSTPKGQPPAMPTPRSRPLVPSPVWSLSLQVGSLRSISHLQQGTGGGTIACPWLAPHCRGAPGLQAGRREGRTDEGWAEGEEG